MTEAALPDAEPGFAATLPRESRVDCEAAGREERFDWESAVAEEDADWAIKAVPPARDAIARTRRNEFMEPSSYFPASMCGVSGSRRAFLTFVVPPESGSKPS